MSVQRHEDASLCKWVAIVTRCSMFQQQKCFKKTKQNLDGRYFEPHACVREVYANDRAAQISGPASTSYVKRVTIESYASRDFCTLIRTLGR